MLDFSVVSLGWISFAPESERFTALRTFRLLRPLRTISGNPGLRVLAQALVESIPLLVDVLALWLFVFVVFGIIGMNLWGGLFHKHCVGIGFDGEWVLSADEVNPKP